MTRAMAAAAAVFLLVVVSPGGSAAPLAQGTPRGTQGGMKPEAALAGKTGGRLVDGMAQRQSQPSSVRMRDVRDSRVGQYGGIALAAGMVLLAGVLAARGRLVLDLGVPRSPGTSGAGRAARRLAGSSFGLLAVSGSLMLYGPDRLPLVFGANGAALAGLAAVVVHAIAAVVLMTSALVVGLRTLLDRSASAEQEPSTDRLVNAPSAGQRLLLPLIAVAVTVACVTGISLVIPFRFPLVGGLSVLEQLSATRLWHVGAGLTGVLVAIVSIAVGTLRMTGAFPSLASRLARAPGRSG